LSGIEGGAKCVGVPTTLCVFVGSFLCVTYFTIFNKTFFMSETNMPVKHKINFINNSTNEGSMMIFQQDENIGIEGVMSLAWLAKYAYPSTTVYFEWTNEYNFVWSETGELKSGVNFYASQTPTCDLSTSNSIGLTYNRAFDFVNQTAGIPSGSLYIKQDGTIPLGTASVGIGMAGAATFVVQAQPNMNLTFTPHPEYWIAFGNYKTGEALNIQEMTNAANVVFPPGIFEMTAMLNPDNSWTIEPTID
jgi:hypothetical protein